MALGVFCWWNKVCEVLRGGKNRILCAVTDYNAHASTLKMVAAVPYPPPPPPPEVGTYLPNYTCHCWKIVVWSLVTMTASSVGVEFPWNALQLLLRDQWTCYLTLVCNLTLVHTVSLSFAATNQNSCNTCRSYPGNNSALPGSRYASAD
jgi:hypothetical protein